MLILPNVGQTKASNTAGSQGIKAQTDNSAAAQDFGSLLSAKVGGAKTTTAAPARNTAANDNSAQPTVVTSPSQATIDDTANGQSDEALVGAGADVVATPLPTGTVVGKSTVKSPSDTADEADPTLDTGAAQTLMALLAQTQPAPVVSRAAGANADITTAAQTAGDPNQVSAASAAGVDQTQAADAGITDASTANTLTVNPATSGALFDQAAVLTTLKAQGGSATADTSLSTTAAETAEVKPLKSLVSSASEKPLKATVDTDDSARTTAATGQGVPATVQRDGANASDTTGLATATTALSKKSAVTLDAASAASPAATPTLSAAGSSTNATPAPAAALISAQLGSDEWQQAIGQQVVMFSRNGQQNAELRLHPAELGAVQISLQVDNNQAQIHLSSGHSQVRAALEAALPHLRTALAESGINLGQSSVGSDATPNWGGGNQNANNPASGQRAFSVTQSATTADSVTPVASATRSLSGIDTFV